MLATQWQGRFGGVPPFDAVDTDAFVDAFKTAIANATTDIEAIATQSIEPSFENTIEALERSGKQLNNLSALFFVHTNNLNLGPIKEAEQVVQPMLSEFADKTIQNAALFQRIKRIFDAKGELGEDQARLLKEKYEEFQRNGALLTSEEDKSRLLAINQRLATLFTNFSQNILEEEKSVIIVDTLEELAGVSDSLIEGFAAAAAKQGLEGKYAVQNTRSSVEALLHSCKNRALREKVWRAFVNRCANVNDHNNYAIITEMVKLRAERAKLLGYQSHAHWRVETEMAKTPETALNLLLDVWPRAKERVKEEVKDMLEVASKEDASVTAIEPWDYRYFSEKVRLARYDLDFSEVTPYLNAERLREGMFYVAEQLHGLSFVQVHDVPVFHEDVRVWEVRRGDTHVGLFYFDPYCREGKRSGAWMTCYRNQSTLLSETPIVSNNSNFVKSELTLISWDDAVTMFHEFGHALHGLLSRVRYATLSGTSVARDFVEFPSQLNEHWLETTQVLEKFARHHATGEPMPATLLEKIKKASNFNQGFKTVEYLSCALLDMKIHMDASGDLPDPAAFEQQTLEAYGMPKEIVMRHRLSHFAHIFSTDSYSAGYYSYMWADTLVADAAEAFQEAPGGFFDANVAKKLHDCVLSVGNSVDPAAAFAAFRGRPVDTQALLRKRGFL